MSTFAKLFALATDLEQAAMLNEAGRTLRRVSDNNAMLDIQLCRVADALDSDGKALVVRLAAFLASDEERRAR